MEMLPGSSVHHSMNCIEYKLTNVSICCEYCRVNSILAKQRAKDNQVAYEGVEEEQAPRNPLDVTSGQEDSVQDLWLLGGVDCKTRM